MQRFYQLLFIASFLALSWFAMMAIHELGHVMGALATGGTVTRVVLYPFTISRTDVLPNPYPAVVVWLGPIAGCLLPLIFAALVPRHCVAFRNMARFFAGFCLIANGVYISIGSFDRVGDCAEMLRTGTPIWALWIFGSSTVPFGFTIRHGLGSFGPFMNKPAVIRPAMAISTLLVLVALVTLEFAISGR